MAAVLDFNIPLDRADLLKQEDPNQFHVEEELEVGDLSHRLDAFKVALDRGDACAILDHFDVFYGAIVHFQHLRFELIEQFWNCSLDSLTILTTELSDYLKEVATSGHESEDRRKTYLSAVQMLIYISTQLTEACETRDVLMAKGRGDLPDAKKGKKGKRATSVRHEGWDWVWETQKSRVVEAFGNVLQLPLKNLWDPPVVEDQFVNVISNCCYMFLENQSVTKNKELLNNIFVVLGHLIEKYSHSIGASVKMMQLLQQYEFLSLPLAQGVVIFCQLCNSRSIVPDVMRELHRIDTDELSREGGSAKNFATFLVELAEKLPEQVLASISLVQSHLDGESYTMRNAVLQVFQVLLLKLLSDENMDEGKRKTRDQLMDNMEEHLHDVNAFVRSKCVSLWTELCRQGKIPVLRLRTLLPTLVGRLHDKASTVRSRSIQFLAAYLENNPFRMLQLSYSKLKTKLEEELTALKAMNPTDHSEVIQAEEIWQGIADGVKQSVKEGLMDLRADWFKLRSQDPRDMSCPISGAEPIADEVTLDEALQKVHRCLSNEDYYDGFLLALKCAKKWPDSRLVQGLFIQEEDWEKCKPAATPKKKKRLQRQLTDEEESVESQDRLAMDELVDRLMAGLKEIFLEMRVTQIMDDQLNSVTAGLACLSPNSRMSAVTKQKITVQYLKDAVKFADIVQSALPAVCILLHSKTVTDILEGLDFITTCVDFDIEGSHAAFRKTLTLVWSKEQNVKEAEVKAFERLYLRSQDKSFKARTAAVATNLINLVIPANESELASLEGVVFELMSQKLLDHSVLRHLWEMFTSLEPDGNEAERRVSGGVIVGQMVSAEIKAALKLISMAASAEQTLIQSNLDQLIQFGLGHHAKRDFEFGRDVCIALEKLFVSPKGEGTETPVRKQPDHELFQRLKQLIVEGFTRLDDPYWTPMMESAVNVLFIAGENPDRMCAGIINHVVAKISSHNDRVIADGDSSLKLQCDTLLSRLFSLLGHVALRLLVHLDVTLCSEFKRRAAAKEKKAEAREAMRKSLSKRKSITRSDAKGKMENSEDDEMGLAGATAEDAELEFVTRLCETEVLSEKGLLGKLVPLIVMVCKKRDKYDSEPLQTNAASALAKFMLMSSKFCEDHLNLLFTLLEKSKFPSVRANLIVALGDLSYRFPNLVEPWTGQLYARLQDKSLLVKQNCLLVLTHLILNDMIKVKGHVADVALLTMDDNEQISGLAKTFFTELGQKGNAIYNLLPDMISRLSDPDAAIDQELFNVVMRFLFGFIQKERQCESLVEKLCQRFHATRSVAQWRMLSYCLTLISYSDKSLRKLQENTICFADKLSDPEIYSNMAGILQAAKKNSKPEVKTLIEEIEGNWEKLHTEGFADDEAATRALLAITRKSVGSSQQGPHSQGSAVNRSLNGSIRSSRRLSVSERQLPVVRASLVPDCLLDTAEVTSKFDRSKRRSVAQMALQYASDENLAIVEMEKLTTKVSDDPSTQTGDADDEDLPLGPNYEIPTDEDIVKPKSSSEESEEETRRYRKGKQRNKRKVVESSPDDDATPVASDNNRAAKSRKKKAIEPPEPRARWTRSRNSETADETPVAQTVERSVRTRKVKVEVEETESPPPQTSRGGSRATSSRQKEKEKSPTPVPSRKSRLQRPSVSVSPAPSGRWTRSRQGTSSESSPPLTQSRNSRRNRPVISSSSEDESSTRSASSHSRMSSASSTLMPPPSFTRGRGRPKKVVSEEESSPVVRPSSSRRRVGRVESESPPRTPPRAQKAPQSDSGLRRSPRIIIPKLNEKDLEKFGIQIATTKKGKKK